MDRPEHLQSAEYVFPYHHLPYVADGGRPRLGRTMRGGMEYLAYLEAVADAVRRLEPGTVLDVGCGDGRLLAALQGSGARLAGVDLDERAVGFARAFAPEATLHVGPVEALDDVYDVVTCIETLEHVPDDLVNNFLAATASRVRTGGHLVVTVPSTVRPVSAKHYRHYDVPSLSEHLRSLGPSWTTIGLQEIVPHRARLDLLLRAVANRLWTIDLPRLNAATLRRHRGPVRPGDRGQHVMAVLRRDG